MSDPTYFEKPADFHAWLKAHHQTATELSVGFWKKDSGHASITWPEAVDQALCFGWIDGVRHRVDDERYRIRFTPRKTGGIWSQVNIKRFAELDADGMIAPAGRKAYEVGKHRTQVYSYENAESLFTAEETAQFKATPKAWDGFQAFPAWYRKVATHRVTSAKGEATRAKRLGILIDASADGVQLKSPTQRAD